MRARVAGAAFALLLIAAAAITLSGAPPAVGLLIGLASLGGYDLAMFQARLAEHEPADRPALRRDHMRALGVTLLAGLVLGGAAALIRTTPGFAGLLALALAAVGLLAALMRHLRDHRGDTQP